MLQIGADVGHGAGDADLRIGQGQHFRRRAAADDMKAQLGVSFKQGRQDLGGEPANGVDIGQVVHNASKNEGYLIGRIGRRTLVVGREIIGVDAVAQRLDANGALRRQVGEVCGFGSGDEEGTGRATGDFPLIGEQAPAFAAVEPGHRPAVLGGVLRPLGRVDIDKIDQHG